MARRARRKPAPRPKHPRVKQPRTPDVPATHRATVTDATGQPRSASTRGGASSGGAAPTREWALPTQSASTDPGLAAVLIELAGVEHGDLRAALAVWQREQDRLMNRAWRRPGGLARQPDCKETLCMLRSQLALWAYTSPTNAAYPLIAREYGAQVEALEVTTVAPGGFGDLSCVLKLPDARLPRPELAVFGRVCLRDGLFTVFGGEWSDPALVLEGAGGEYALLSALGGGVALRDDPDDAAYNSSTTAQGIIANEFAKRAAYLPIDPDQSAVLPSAPANTFTPVYDGYTLEEILHDLMGALGDYVWTVYVHPHHVDAAGYPAWQLQAHPRDTTTTHYLALGSDISAWRVMPSAQRAYNVVEVAFVDPVAGPGVVTVSDPRLNGDGSQGSAPFRRRKLRRNLGRLPLTSTQAMAIGNAWLATYSNPTNKVEIELRAVRNANGNAVPLHQVRADRNLFVPELAVRGQQLSSGPVPGTNQFWIAESRYRELPDGDTLLTLQLDNYADRAAALVARLQIAFEARERRRGIYRPVQSPGAQQIGYCSIRAPSATAGQSVGVGLSFVPVLSNTPTGLTFHQIAATNVGSGPSVTAGTLTPYGCEVTVSASATGAVVWTGTYTTVGA